MEPIVRGGCALGAIDDDVGTPKKSCHVTSESVAIGGLVAQSAMVFFQALTDLDRKAKT